MAAATFERIELDATSWVEVARGWLDDADDLYDSLVDRVPWRRARLWRYERWMLEPRLTAWCAVGRPMPDPRLLDVHRAVRDRCGVPFDGFSLAWYRDGRDSVAFHRDRDLRWCEETRVALLVLGQRRPFLLRPRAHRYDHDAPRGGATHDLAPGEGDLMILGGRCQADWEHSVPKVDMTRRGRISLQWRWTSRTGRPEQGASYRSPRTYSRS